MNFKIKKEDYDQLKFHEVAIEIQRETLSDDDVEKATFLYASILSSLILVKKEKPESLNDLSDAIIQELGLNESLKEYVASIYALLDALTTDFEHIYIKKNREGKTSIRID